MHPRENFSAVEFVDDFGSFLQSQNIAGLAIGFLIGTSTLDTSKTIVRTMIMPLVSALQDMQTPEFEFDTLLESLLTFVMTMLVCYFLLKLGRIAPKPVSLVQVINN